MDDDLLGEVFFRGACADEDGDEVVAVVDVVGKLCETIGGPMFFGFGGTDAEDDVRGSRLDAHLLQAGTHVFLNGGSDGEAEVFFRLIDAKVFGESPKTIDDVLCFGDGDFVGVEERGEFPGVREAKAMGCGGYPGEKRASKESLEVEDEVEVFVSDVFDEAEERGGGGGAIGEAGEFFSVEQDDFVELGMFFEEVCEVGSDEPCDVGLRPGGSEAVEDGQGADDIAEATGFDDEDVFGIDPKRGHLCFG